MIMISRDPCPAGGDEEGSQGILGDRIARIPDHIGITGLQTQHG
jgi:hypothetical protein